MNSTIKETTVRRYHYQSTDELNKHLHFLLAYNHAKRLKTLLHGLTPHKFVCAQWQKISLTLTKTTLRWDCTTRLCVPFCAET